MGDAKKNRCYTPGTVNAESVSKKIFLLWLGGSACAQGYGCICMVVYEFVCVFLYIYIHLRKENQPGELGMGTL